ncbi:SDR family NAD(P)-dependent oxidoreductase [Methylophaga sp.]|uniref:SDR family NAD(P)-dependent oxidoreductase n=1 Tax=Methylophaga sp. TaxID=2024840 RepID=UPI0013FF02AC|nr:SDR family NAD(P)-dependent oxidoreductase [Methylophaga sp.]MTI63890.1 SDR family NAD(P)-dependent oxidoreductase [Methylophaga sp.]
MTHSALIIGGGSHIGRAIINQLLQSKQPAQITVVSRGSQPSIYKGLAWHQSDYSEASMARLVNTFNESGRYYDQVFICHGILHDDQVSPEKRLEDLDSDSMQHVFQVNAITPALWLKHLLPLLKQSALCKVAIFSARVGSIDDNHLGGWYSYRASKAALNMLLKSAAVEYARRAPEVKLLAFHPGTADTPLSRPFSKNVPEGKLFQPTFVAERLLAILDSLEPDGELSFLDWQHERIAW